MLETRRVGELLVLSDREYLCSLAEELDGAHRLGTDVASTGGTRWIEVSDELAVMIAERLRAIAAQMEMEL